MNPDPHSPGRAAVWAAEVDGARHVVEVEFSFTGGDWLVWMDGVLLKPPGERREENFEFAIGDHACRIRSHAKRFTLYVDGWRIPRLDSGKLLLRPSAAPHAERELLRPAESVETVTERLLRPSEENGGERAANS